MAKAKSNKKVPLVGMELPECPVCFETMTAPIYNCQTGHSLCAGCSSKIRPAICPICREPMTQMRNRTLEDIISKAVINCPNKDKGCILNFMVQNMDNHLKECIFREIECPLGAVFGKCSWNGEAKNLLQHFKDRHPNNFYIDTGSDIVLNNVSITEDDRHVFLVTQGKHLFILTVKIDTIQKMAYWIMQLIGSMNTAKQYVYEIHISNQQYSRRKVSFFEYCFNDSVKPDEIFREAKCSIVPLNMLNHFIKFKKLVFRFEIKRISDNPKPTEEDKEGSQVSITDEESQGPQMSGGRFPGRRGRGNRGRGPRSRGFKNRGSSGHRSSSPCIPGESKVRPM